MNPNEVLPNSCFVGYAEMFVTGRETAFAVTAPASSLELTYSCWDSPSRQKWCTLPRNWVLGCLGC